MTATVRRLIVLTVALLVAAMVAPPPTLASGLPPQVRPDTFEGRVNQKLEAVAPGVLVNDTDPEGDLLIVRLAHGPSYGEIELQADGSFLYIPGSPTVSYDYFSYQAFDGSSWSATTYASVILHDDPVARDDRYALLGSRHLEVPVESGILSNDSGLPALRPVLLRGPSDGTLVLSRDGSFTYDVDRRFEGTDTFTYRVRDGGGVPSKAAVVTIRVRRTNAAPIAVADEYRVQEDTVLIVDAPGLLGNDVDGDADKLRAEIVDYPNEGSLDVREDGSLFFQTDSNQDNDAYFAYRVTDEFEWSEPVTVRIDVIAVNDPPIAESDQFEGARDTELEVNAPGVLANDYDPVEFDEPLVWELVQKPEHGSLDLRVDGGFTYKPDAGFSGSDRFVYRVGDTGGPGGVAYVDLSIDE